MAAITFLRRQWLGILLLVAICVSFSYTLAQSRVETALIRSEAIQVCTDVSIAQALIVAFKQEVADDARLDGHESKALRYEALARGGLAVIPLPPGSENRRPQLSQFVFESSHVDIPEETKALMREGCAAAYDPD